MRSEDRTPLSPAAGEARKPWRRPQLQPLHNLGTEGGDPEMGLKWLMYHVEKQEIYTPGGTFSGSPS